MQKRLFIERLSANGLDKLSQSKKFSTFNAKAPFQQEMQKLVYNYAVSDIDNWLYIGGQRGSGKTHLCIAATVKLSRRYNVQYFVWEDNADELTSGSYYSEDERRRKINMIKNAEVLYIDDFLRKTEPKEKEIRLAFEIINYRYNRNLRTIITSEKNIQELYHNIDSAIAGRIAEKCGTFKYTIQPDPSKDYRIYGG